MALSSCSSNARTELPVKVAATKMNETIQDKTNGLQHYIYSSLLLLWWYAAGDIQYFWMLSQTKPLKK